MLPSSDLFSVDSLPLRLSHFPELRLAELAIFMAEMHVLVPFIVVDHFVPFWKKNSIFIFENIKN
jgi:hypothetical protein